MFFRISHHWTPTFGGRTGTLQHFNVPNPPAEASDSGPLPLPFPENALHRTWVFPCSTGGPRSSPPCTKTLLPHRSRSHAHFFRASRSPLEVYPSTLARQIHVILQVLRPGSPVTQSRLIPPPQSFEGQSRGMYKRTGYFYTSHVVSTRR